MRYVVVLLAVLLVPVAGAAAASPGPPAPLVAQKECLVRGFIVGTTDFAACVARGGSGRTAAPTVPSTPPKATLAKLACRNKGLKQGTQAFLRCLAVQAKLAKHTKALAP